jgi:hypothetical protein
MPVPMVAALATAAGIENAAARTATHLTVRPLDAEVAPTHGYVWFMVMFNPLVSRARLPVLRRRKTPRPSLSLAPMVPHGARDEDEITPRSLRTSQEKPYRLDGKPHDVVPWPSAARRRRSITTRRRATIHPRSSRPRADELAGNPPRTPSPSCPLIGGDLTLCGSDVLGGAGCQNRNPPEPPSKRTPRRKRRRRRDLRPAVTCRESGRPGSNRRDVQLGKRTKRVRRSRRKGEKARSW